MSAPETPTPTPPTPAASDQAGAADQAGAVDQAGGRPLIREWHTLTAAEQASEWQALLAWVIWIHDLYELSREERLPLCWPQHPGLIEELRSLKAWRDLIYDTPSAAATPHTARSWHGELRQTITAALHFWAPGCRAGHTDAVLFTDADPALTEKWRTLRPPVMASAPPPAPAAAAAAAVGTGVGRVDTVSDVAMAAAVAVGTAREHSRGMPYYARYDDAWWTRSTDGTCWDRCQDATHAAKLDRSSRQLRGADAALDKHTQHKDGH